MESKKFDDKSTYSLEDHVMDWLYGQIDVLLTQVQEKLGDDDLQRAKRLLVEAAQNC